MVAVSNLKDLCASKDPCISLATEAMLTVKHSPLLFFLGYRLRLLLFAHSFSTTHEHLFHSLIPGTPLANPHLLTALRYRLQDNWTMAFIACEGEVLPVCTAQLFGYYWSWFGPLVELAMPSFPHISRHPLSWIHPHPSILIAPCSSAVEQQNRQDQFIWVDCMAWAQQTRRLPLTWCALPRMS